VAKRVMFKEARIQTNSSVPGYAPRCKKA